MSLWNLSVGLVEKIFAIKDIDQPDINDIGEDLNNAAKLVAIPTLESAKLQKILDDYSNNSSWESAFSSSGIQLSFRFDFAKQFSNTIKGSEKSVDYVTIRILYNTLAFMAQHTIETSGDLFMPVLSSLIYALNSVFSEVAAEMYEVIFRDVLTMKEFYTYNLDVNELQTYLQKYPSIDFIKYVLTKTIESGASTSSKFFSQILESFPIILTDIKIESDEEIVSIVQLFTPYLCSLDLPSLSFFGRVIPRVDQHLALHDIVVNITKSFIALIKETNKIHIKRIEKQTPMLLHMSSTYTKFHEKVFETDLDATKYPNIPTVLSYSELTSQNEAELVEFMIKAFKDAPSCCSLFVDMIIDEIKSNINTDNYFSLWNAAAEIVIKVKQLSNTKVDNSPLNVSKPLFYEGDTVFNQSEDFTKLNSLRDRFIDLFLEDYEIEEFDQFFSDMSQSPLLMSEFCLRLINRNAKVIEKYTTDPKYIESIMKSTALYQNIFFESNNETIITARECTLILLKYLLQNDTAKEYFFSNKESAQNFLTFLFEPNLIDLVLGPLKEFLMIPSTSKVTNVTCSLTEIIAAASKYLPENRAVSLLSRIILSLNDACTVNSNVRCDFIDIVPLFTEIYNALDKNELSRQFVKFSLSFLALMSAFSVIKEVELEALSKCVKRISDEDYQFYNEILYHFMELLSGNYLSSKSCSFVIKSLEIPKYLLKLYWKTPYFTSVIDNFKQLCTFSSNNIELLCTAGVDIMILNLLDEAKNDKESNPAYVDAMMDLFFITCSIHSKNQTVLKFISLFSPTNTKEVSQYNYKFLQALNHIIEDSNDHNIRYYPLNKTIVECPIHEFPSITDSFAFCCWLYIEHNNADYRPFVFNFQNGQAEIGIFISGQSLCYVVSQGEMQASTKINATLPLQKWCFLAISVKFYSNRIQCNTSIDLKKCEATNMPRVDLTEKATFYIRGGNYQKEPDTPHRMAFPVLLNYLEQNEFAKIRQLGIKTVTEVPNSIYIFNHDKYLMEIIPQFLHTLIYNDLIPALYPLFMYSESNPTYYFESAISIMTNLMKFSKQAQTSFYNSKGIEIISHLLYEQWNRNLTPKIYSYFEGFLEVVGEDLQKAIFSKILTNFDILVQMQQEYQIKIIKSWANKLFVNYDDLAIECCNYDKILAALRTHYYYEPLETDIIVPRKYDIDVTNIRKALFVLLLRFGQSRFDFPFFGSMVSHILAIKDKKQVNELMETCLNYVNSGYCKFNFADPKYFTKFIEIFSINQVFFRCFMLEISQTLLKFKEYKSEFFVDVAKRLISVYSKSQQDLTLYDAVLKSLKNLPEFTSLACALAVKFEPKQMNQVLDYLSADSFIKVDRTGFMWPVILLFKLDKEHATTLMEFICVAKDRWNDIFAMFEVIGGTRNLQTYELKVLFITTAARLLIEKQIHPSKPTLDTFFQISQGYILYRDANEPNPKLVSMISETYQEFQDTSMTSRIMFRLRFTPEGDWADEIVARRIIDVFLEFNCTKHTAFILTLIGFMMRTKNPSINYELTKMSLTEKERTEYMDAITYYAYECQRVKKPCYFSKTSVPKNGQFLFDYFEKISASPFTYTLVAEIRESIIMTNRELHTSLSVLRDTEVEDMVSEMDAKCKKFGLHSRTFNLKDGFFWEVLWSNLAIDGGLWMTAKDPQPKNYRINCGTIGGVPLKLGEKPINRRDEAQEFTSEEKLASYPGMWISYGNKLACYFELNPECLVMRSLQHTIAIPVNEIRAAVLTDVGEKVTRIEFMSMNGDSFLIEFTGVDTRSICNSLMSAKPTHLEYCIVDNLKEVFEENKWMEEWKNRKITNFNYICLLNSLTGRSFDSLEKYPVFPNITENRDFSTLLKIPDEEYVRKLLANVNPYLSDVKPEINNEYEVIPEYYSSPEVFEKTVENSFEFIYKNRQLLESEEVSANLHKWINAMFPEFGVHEQRNPEVTVQRVPAQMSAGMKGICIASFENRHFSLLLETSKILKFDIDLERVFNPDNNGINFDDENSCHNFLDYNIESAECLIPTNAKSIVALEGDRFAFVRSVRPYLQIVGSNGVMNAPIPSASEVTCVAKSGNYIAIGSVNAELFVLCDGKLKFSAKTFRDPFQCIAVSDTFGCIAVATTTGSLSVFSLATGNAIFNIDLKGIKPKELLISPSWGFIVMQGTKVTEVKEENFLQMFSINGKLIFEKMLETNIACWNYFSDAQGFDHVILCIDKRIEICELNEAAEFKTVRTEEERIIAISYVREVNGVIYITSAGNIHVVPL